MKGAPSWERAGAWRLGFAEGAPREALRRLLLDLDAGDRRPAKSSRHREVSHTELEGEGRVFVKRDFCIRTLDRLRTWPRRSRAHQEFVNLLRAGELGIRAARPWCVAERRSGWLLREAVLVTEAVPESRHIDDLREVDPRWLEALGGIARRLHDAGAWHRDLHTGNVLASRGELVLIDLQKLRRLPLSLPVGLRARDLAPLATSDESRRAVLGGYGCDDPVFAERVRRSAERHRRRRLRSRGRRCVLDSSGFRRERRGGLRLYRRADIDGRVVVEALDKAGTGDARVENVLGGPAAGPAPDRFARGHAAPEPGAPARGPVDVRAFPPAARPGRSPGMRAWRAAHAALLRELEVPAPLALAEEAGPFGRSWLLTRAEPLVPLCRAIDPLEALGRAARTLAALHARGLTLRRADLSAFGARESDPTPVLRDPADLRGPGRVSQRARVANLRQLATSAAQGDGARRDLLRALSVYREADAAALRAWDAAFGG